MGYKIIIAGMLDQSWSNWLGDALMETAQSENESTVTTITLDESDPAQLFGILDHIRDLNLSLIGVTKLENNPEK